MNTIADLAFDELGPIVYAQIRGDIDMSNVQALRQELSIRTPNEALGLVLDFRDVTYLDSAGIHLLHRVREDLRAGGQGIQLIIPSGSAVSHTLRLAGMTWPGEVQESFEDAQTALRNTFGLA